jgi:hypothetical protein
VFSPQDTHGPIRNNEMIDREKGHFR